MRSICLALCLIVLPSIPALAAKECCTIVSVDPAANAVIVREIATGKTKTLTISNTRLIRELRPGMIFGPTAIAGIQTSPRTFEPDWAANCCNFIVTEIGSVEIGPGVSVDNISITRLGSRSVRLKFDVSNTSGKSVYLGKFGMVSDGVLVGISLLDFDGGKRYTVLKDKNNNCVCSSGPRNIFDLGPGERRTYWANFAAPPPSVTRLTFDISGGVPIDNIPVK